jgi:hypothetical protein
MRVRTGAWSCWICWCRAQTDWASCAPFDPSLGLPELNIIVMTGLTMAPADLPDVPVLFKPFTIDALLGMVNRYSFRPPPGIV